MTLAQAGKILALKEEIERLSTEGQKWMDLYGRVQEENTILSAENSRLQEIMRHCIDCQLALGRASTQPSKSQVKRISAQSQRRIDPTKSADDAEVVRDDCA